MHELIIDQLDDEVQVGLQRLASDHGRTMVEEARDLLRRAVGATAPQSPARPAEPQGGLGSRIASRFAECALDQPIPELRGQIHLQIPDFNS